MAIDTFKCSMQARSRVVGVALTLAMTGCVTSPSSISMPPPDVLPPQVVRPPAVSSPIVQTGRASWYGEPHHGQKTANGETYDMRQLTAAHRTFPLGTRLLVTNLRNRRTVEVRVNDRARATRRPIAAVPARGLRRCRRRSRRHPRGDHRRDRRGSRGTCGPTPRG